MRLQRHHPGVSRAAPLHGHHRRRGPVGSQHRLRRDLRLESRHRPDRCAASSSSSKSREFVAAARLRGESAWYIMLVEILPNARGPLIVDICIRIGYVAFTIGTLGFLGLGPGRRRPTGAGMVNAARNWILVAPWVAAFPASRDLLPRRRVEPLRRRAARDLPQGLMAPLLQLKDLAISYATRAGEIQAVRAVSLTIERGQAYGLVRRVRLRQRRRWRWPSWRIWDGTAGSRAARSSSMARTSPTQSAEELRALRGRRIAMVYQDPLASLNPCLTVGEQLSEVLTVHQGLGARASRTACHAMTRTRPHARPARDHAPLPAPDLGRAAAARGHRDGPPGEPRSSGHGRSRPPAST